MGFYQYHVFCCLNERECGHPRGCCLEKGSSALRDYFKDAVKKKGLAGPGKVRVNAAGCLDRCELGPVVVIYPDEVWYHIETQQDVDEIIESHLLSGLPVARLRLGDKQKRLADSR
jgi:(2Fe-2S) ferredoxin